MTTMTRGQVLEKVREAQAAGRRADLSNADLRSADLTRAILTVADLRDANLRGADLRHAYLRDAYLAGATLAGATLRDADLTYATLYGVDLTGTDLTGADLTDTWLHCAHLTPQQLLDTRGLRPKGNGLTHGMWRRLLPEDPQQRQLAEHLLNDDWEGTLREALKTAEGLTGR